VEFLSVLVLKKKKKERFSKLLLALPLPILFSMYHKKKLKRDFLILVNIES
jgi:hypothetical protein